MRLVTTILSASPLNDYEIENAQNAIQKYYNNQLEIQKYKYEDRKYYEVDIDLLDVQFLKENIHEEIDKLIKAYEEIIDETSISVDIICANDDTESEIIRYENDKNDVTDFGLFVTTREISDLSTYYSSDKCNAYLNFKYVSFGCIF